MNLEKIELKFHVVGFNYRYDFKWSNVQLEKEEISLLSSRPDTFEKAGRFYKKSYDHGSLVNGTNFLEIHYVMVSPEVYR